MGIVGIEVVKESFDIIIFDDNFIFVVKVFECKLIIWIRIVVVYCVSGFLCDVFVWEVNFWGDCRWCLVLK